MWLPVAGPTGVVDRSLRLSLSSTRPFHPLCPSPFSVNLGRGPAPYLMQWAIAIKKAWRSFEGSRSFPGDEIGSLAPTPLLTQFFLW